MTGERAARPADARSDVGPADGGAAASAEPGRETVPVDAEREMAPVAPDREVALVDLVDRVLDRGAVVTGELVISVAGVDLVYVGLQLVLSSVETMRRRDASAAASDGG